MPITIYLDGYKPDPETKRVMGVAFEAARIALRLADRGDAFAPIVAKKIIELANEGERNPDLLCERALKDLREPPLRSGGFLWRRLSNSSATDRGERPERYVEPFRLDTMPSRPSLHACLNTVSLRNDPLEGRKATLEMILAKARPGIRFNEHMEGDGQTVFAHACKMGLEGNCVEAEGFDLPFWPLARLAQNEERGCTGCETGRRGAYQ